MWIVLCHAKRGAFVYFADEREYAQYHFNQCVENPPTDDTESVELIYCKPGHVYHDGDNVELYMFVDRE